MGDHLLVDGHVHVQIVHAELLELLRPGGFVRDPHEVDHDFRAVPTRRLDGLEDRRIVRDAHHGDHIGPGLRRDLRLEGAGIHRLQVGDDRLPREGLLQLAHDLHPFGLDQRRPGLEPVRPSLDGLLRGEEGPLPMHVVQGDLQDGLHGACLPRAHDKYVTTRAHVAARVSKKGYETAA